LSNIICSAKITVDLLKNVKMGYDKLKNVNKISLIITYKSKILIILPIEKFPKL